QQILNFQNGLNGQHLIGGSRELIFPTIFGSGASARAVLDPSTSTLALISIQNGDAGGAGLTTRYGAFAGGPSLHLDLTPFSSQRIEVQLAYLLAGDSKGPQPGISWRTTISSRDASQVSHFTNVDLAIGNTSTPLSASIPVSSLIGGSANA